MQKVLSNICPNKISIIKQAKHLSFSWCPGFSKVDQVSLKHPYSPYIFMFTGHSWHMPGFDETAILLQ